MVWKYDSPDRSGSETCTIASPSNGWGRESDGYLSFSPQQHTRGTTRNRPSPPKRARTDTDDTSGERPSKRTNNAVSTPTPLLSHQSAPSTLDNNDPVIFALTGSTPYREDMSSKSNAVQAVKACEDIGIENVDGERVLGNKPGIKLYRGEREQRTTLESLQAKMEALEQQQRENMENLQRQQRENMENLERQQREQKEKLQRERQKRKKLKMLFNHERDTSRIHRHVTGTALQHIEKNLHTRERFLATFKRDQKYFSDLEPANDRDRELIAATNAEIHGGDARADAELYMGEEYIRNDIEVYRALYGFTPEQVLEHLVDHQYFLDVLNVHATNVSDYLIDCDDEYHKAWGKLIFTFMEHKCPASDLASPSDKTRLGRAFLEYESVRQKHVHRRNRRPENSFYPPPTYHYDDPETDISSEE